ncbi:MAG: helix-turn-helix domain-containing protein [Alphaproteobacteria bacterium]
MDIRKVIARNVRRVRVAQNLSQEALAIDAGVDRTHVSRIERAIENPTVLTLERIAIALGVDFPTLFAVPKRGEPEPSLLPKGRKRRK